jgi:hypothetical protein
VIGPTQDLVSPQFRITVDRQRGKNRSKRFAGSRCTDLYRLFDYMHTLGSNPLAKKPARGPFARLVFSNHPRSGGQPAGESRSHCALKIDTHVVVFNQQLLPQSTNFPKCL